MKHRWLVIGAASTSTTGAGLRDFRALLLPTTTSSPSEPVALPLVFTHAFPGVAVSPGLADGNVPFSSVFIGRGEHGKRSRASSVVPPRERGGPSPPPLFQPSEASVTTRNPFCSGRARK